MTVTKREWDATRAEYQIWRGELIKPIPPPGEGWRLVTATHSVATGVIWYWERDLEEAPAKVEKKPYVFMDSINYPYDETGEYVDLVGTIVKIGDTFRGVTSVTVDTITNGHYVGLARGTPSECGKAATIRVYRHNGGRYMDNIIISWVL